MSATVLLTGCAYCRSAAGVPCTSADGAPLRWEHIERTRDA